ncbi:centromere protein M isoform X2 [Pseudophryne corroboree]|uniref:centromere protein M isoform X2 n=1 Tax=Pseudophryne corroboree TaxID=495146 RepID=UPI0030812019
MATLRMFDKLPAPNIAAILLVGSDESHQEIIANALLKEPKTFHVKIHMATSLPISPERAHLRPCFDMVVFFINLHSKHSLSSVMSSMKYLDSHFFLGKVCFLTTKGRNGEVQHSAVDITTVKDLADQHRSILIQSALDNEDDVAYTAQRLLNLLKICAGLMPDVSSMSVWSVMKSSVRKESRTDKKLTE